MPLSPLLNSFIFSAFVLSAQLTPAAPLAHNCPGGRYVTTVETVQQQNWIQNAATVYDRKESFVRLPHWLGRVTVIHATQGFLLSGEERIGRWTKVTVPPSLTLTMRLFGRSFYIPVLLPVVRDFEACRDMSGGLYVR